MTTKVFKTIDEQIEILKEKGMIINDYDYAKNVLLRENYFFLMGYRHLFVRKDSSKLRTQKRQLLKQLRNGFEVDYGCEKIQKVLSQSK